MYEFGYLCFPAEHKVPMNTRQINIISADAVCGIFYIVDFN